MRLHFTIRDWLWLAVPVALAQFVDNRPLVFGQRRWVHGLRLEFYLDVIQIGAACIRNLLLTCRCNDMCDASKRSDIGFKDCQSVGRVGDDHSHFHFAATHASIRQRARTEVERVLGKRAPTFADVAHLNTTRMVIEESMRLYPPIWAMARQVVADDEIGGFRIPRGSMIALVPFVTHRHPSVWPEPDKFDPERFASAQNAQRPKGAYFPFLGGPHQCIGNEFAMIEMQLIVAMVLQQFDLELVPDQAIVPRASITLRPSGPLRLILKRMDRPAQ